MTAHSSSASYSLKCVFALNFIPTHRYLTTVVRIRTINGFVQSIEVIRLELTASGPPDQRPNHLGHTS